MKKYHIEANTVQETLVIPLYRDSYKDVGFIHKLMIKMCDNIVKMRIVKIRTR